MASALVLWRYAEDVQQRTNASQITDAQAGIGLGQHRDGGRIGEKAPSVAALHSVSKGADGSPRGLSVLNRHQFCRGQKGRAD